MSPPRARREVPSPKGVVSPADRFRGEIARAMALGTGPADLILRLTRGDANRLLRDPLTAAADIRFQDGVMRFLDVRIEQGGVDASTLDLVGGRDVGADV